MFGLGWTEVMLLGALGALGALIPVLGAVDAALKPDPAWAAAGQNKLVWVILQIAGAFLLLGLPITLVYLIAIRPKVKARMTRPAP
jgi:hypothetical protein